MIIRDAQNKLIQLANSFKAIAVIGPRQSGKTTLVKATFPKKKYISLENPDNGNFALEDPRGFLQNFPNGAILDEIQRVPSLFSYLQEILDNNTTKGLFILTGSNNFLLQENIAQTLAGRIGYLTLLPFTISEIKPYKINKKTDNEIIFNGFYPPIFDQQIKPTDWYPNYIRTYIERDVRQIIHIQDLYKFQQFIKICAGRIGRLVNYSSISNELGISYKTIQSWLSVLVASYVVFLVPPFYKNFNKRLVKSPI